MKLPSLNDHKTIIALASGLGGGVALIRISGDKAFEIASKMTGKEIAWWQSNPRKAVYSNIYIDGKKVDDVVLTPFVAPHSYTGENVIEIGCHASLYIIQKLIDQSTKSGARLAEAGEFTLRAFRNGKMDLIEAEAIADLIASETEEQHAIAIDQLDGHLSRYLESIRQQLLRFTSLMELELDFSEEDVEFVDRTELLALADDIQRQFELLKESFRSGQAIKNGIPIALIGEPNVGKSSILNNLLEEDRAIVSNIPGTTRDAIEGVLHIKGKTFRITDTAGIRETEDTIENLGIERSKAQIASSRLLLIVIDATRPNIDLISSLIQPEDKEVLILLNKIDLVSDSEALRNRLQSQTPYPILPIRSLFPASGFEELKQWMAEVAQKETESKSLMLISNARHLQAICQALESIQRVIEALQQGIPSDLITPDLRLTLDCIGEITGQTISSDDTLHYIFSHFCIGK